MDYIRNEFVEESTAVIRAGKKGQPQTLTQGGTQATGSIQFSANPTTGDTIVLNGVTITFGPAADVNNSTNLATTLAALTAFYNASVNPLLTVATATDNTVDTFTLTYDTNGVAGNSYTIVTTGLTAAPTAADTALTGGQDTPSLSLDTDVQKFTLTQAGDQDFSLANGAEAQEKTVIFSSKGSTGNVVITPTNLTGGTTLTLSAAAQFHKLVFAGGSWQAIAGTGTIA